MRRSNIISILCCFSLIQNCQNESAKSEKFWLGNWCYIDEELNRYFPYTELYFNDTIYAVRNELFGTMIFRYWVLNDTLYRADGSQTGQAFAHFREHTQDHIKFFGQDGEKILYRLDIGQKGYFEYNVDDSTGNHEKYNLDFENRAIKFYVKNGRFSDKNEYLRFRNEIEKNTIIDEF